MAATGIVLSVAQTLFAALQCKELRELCSNFKYESQLEALRGTVETIQNVLLDVESGQQELNNQGLNWVNKLKDAVYDADDLFDEIITVAQRQKRMPEGKISKKVQAFFSGENKLLFDVRTFKKVKEIREKLDSIAADHHKFGFSDVYRPVKRKEETWSYVHEDRIIGRKHDKEVIIDMLSLGDSDSSINNVSFVSIVGMGGLGKTALAQHVYDDDRIKSAFELKLWVCVSDEFIIEQILGKMFKSATQQDHGDIGVDGLQNKVRQLIEGKKYFLILDDLWNERREEWLKLREFLQVGAKGSRVVVTTRSKKVAGAIGDDPMHTLEGLSDDDSWHLFRRVAFNQGSGEVDDDLADIGKDIVKKCANVPLAIRVVGSMLYGHCKSDWELFQSIKLSEIMGRSSEESIMPILKFSYHHLKPQLKSCFSYCALFPKDYQIEKELLIRLWSAQGYLDNDKQSREDVGEEYFSILLQRCFLQDFKYSDIFKTYSCKMHDLIHDLAQEVAGKESYFMEETSKRSDAKTRHIVHRVSSPLLNQSNTYGNFKGLRTYLQLSWCYGGESQVSTIIAKYRRLRVLDLHELRIKALPSTIKYLLHLRYLDLSLNRELKMLPESITRLYNLQVLSLRSCSNLEELPKDMRELVNLRHLDLTDCRGLTHMPAGMDSMTGLCTLTRFVLGSESSKKAQIAQLRDLMPLINIRGTLEIVFKKRYAYDLTEQEACLSNKKHIKSLTIINEGWHEKEAVLSVDERLLERLEPHRDLREIDIWGYKGVTLPRWAATLEISLPQLVKIQLMYFPSLRRLPAMSQLQHLKDLSLIHMPNVELMEKNDSKVAHSFPSLEELYLEKCPSLKSFPRCPHVKTFTLLGLNEALTFCQERDDEANATTPAASSISASSSSSKDNNSAGGDVFDLRELEIDSFQLMKSLFGESIRSIDELRLHDDMEVESLSSVVQEYQRQCTLSIDSRLVLQRCRNLKSVSGGGIEYLTNLKTLQINDCPKLELEEEQGFPWKDLHALSDLTLSRLPQMRDIPNGIQYLTSLKSLNIQFCPELEPEEEKGFLWKDLHGLSYLRLKTLPQMRDIPKGIQYLTSLQTLYINRCENMKTHPEWLHCPNSLRSLEINYCPMVKTLPEANLPSLTRLTIWSCDGLKERYSKPNGTHFSQISHIPSLTLYFESSCKQNCLHHIR